MPVTDLTGTWVFNDRLNISDDITWNVNYTTNSEDYTDLRISLQSAPMGNKKPCMGTAAFPVLFYNMGIWDDRYKTITITSKLSEVTDGDTLLAWLQANATKQESTTKVSIDLTTLSGWSSLSTGSHSITIVAKADGYRDSEPSAAVSVTKAAPVYTDCITFTGETSDFTLAVGSDGAKEWDGTVQYSTDHNTWTVWDGTAISSVDKKLYLRGSGNTTFNTNVGAQLRLSAKAACSGNIQTLLEYSNPPPTTLANFCYSYMFYGCTNLTQAPELPATTLTLRCYEGMFSECTGLTTAPELPATTLANFCYQSMFERCTSLKQAPALPATTLTDYCYNDMFRGCTSLTQAPELPATTLANFCYHYMFSECTGLTTAPELPATTLTSHCYHSMFSLCTSLTTAPALPATTLASGCYSYMFYGCTSLKISATQSSEYPTAWRIPSSGTISSTATNWNASMLTNTGGTFTSNPSINTTYYGAW